VKERKHWTKKIKEELERVKKEKEEYRDLYLRTLADFDNYKKKMESEWKKAVEYSTERLVYELLPVLDNFKRALEASENTQDIESLRKGIELIYKQLLAVLEKEGLRSYETVGLKFDPRIHEAVTTVETKDVLPGTVVEELESGYFFKEKLLRPAKVSVSKEPSGAPSEESKKGGM
jgi:molecular chaperone GrpE